MWSDGMDATSENMIKSDSLNRTGLDQTLVISRSAFFGFLLKRLENYTDAEDVFQEFCIRVMTKKDQLRNTERMDAWLYAILRSSLNDFYRKVDRSKRLKEAIAQEVKTAELYENSTENENQICKCVKGLVNELRPVESELIRRIDIEEEERSVVATDLNLKPGTMNVKLHRAREALGIALKAHCGQCCSQGFDDCNCASKGCG